MTCSTCPLDPSGTCFVCRASDIANLFIRERGKHTDNPFIHALALRLALECELRYMKQLAPEKFERVQADLERIAGLSLTLHIDDFSKVPKA